MPLRALCVVFRALIFLLAGYAAGAGLAWPATLIPNVSAPPLSPSEV